MNTNMQKMCVGGVQKPPRDSNVELYRIIVWLLGKNWYQLLCIDHGLLYVQVQHHPEKIPETVPGMDVL